MKRLLPLLLTVFLLCGCVRVQSPTEAPDLPPTTPPATENTEPATVTPTTEATEPTQIVPQEPTEPPLPALAPHIFTKRGTIRYITALLLPQHHDPAPHPHGKFTAHQSPISADSISYMGDPVSISHRLIQFIRCDRQISLHSCAPLWNKKDCDMIY
jgi:hypothetical protein